jgi:outer membrane receptor protein involved in Fe transport
VNRYPSSNVARAAILCGSLAATWGASAQTPANGTQAAAKEELAEVVVTGSRVITNGNDSPTPVTVVSIAELQAANPGLMSQALALVPALLATPNQGGQGAGGAAVINLRGIGANRNLVLFDGHRVAPTTGGSGVDSNLIPSMLLKRVDIVTGGASAVYGSDAVSGVVNYIIDSNFNGLKVTAQTGISTFGDDRTYNIGVAMGTPLFGGRGHIEFSYQNSNDPGIATRYTRNWGRGLWSDQGSVPGSTSGAGTAANPYTIYSNTRLSTTSFGGLINNGPLAGQQFAQNGVLSAFNHGAATGTSSVEVGGDGGYNTSVSGFAGLNLDQAFTRFDFSFTDSVKAYAELSATTSLGWNIGNNVALSNRAIGYNNAFLATVQPTFQTTIAAQLKANALSSFNFSKIFNQFGQNDAFPAPKTETRGTDYMFLTGIEGVLGQYKWDVGYGRTDAVTTTFRPDNYSNPRLFAALNAVVNPANGQVVCNAALANPSVYGNCVPLNVFGPTASNRAAFDYISNPSQNTLTYLMDDWTAGISGAPISTWAGPVDMALSAEWRKLSYRVLSREPPTDSVSCTGIQFNCSATSLPNPYASTTANFPKIAVNVREAAYEFQAPLLKDVFLAKSLGFNGAVRYTNYSTSGTVYTWKAGLTWAMNNALALRAARSRDIRAPTLQNLYAPQSSAPLAMIDVHTGNTNGTLLQITQGNPNLTPEIADTWTAGFVWTPRFADGFSLTMDYYYTKIKNGLVTFNTATPAVQLACEASGGTSPICALYNRPAGCPFSNTSPSCYPISVFNQTINSAGFLAYGIDTEIDWSHPIAGHNFRLRALANYQPHLVNDLGPAGIFDVGGAADGIAGQAATPNVKGLLQVNYEVVHNFTAIVQERYRNAIKNYAPGFFVFAIGKLPPAWYTDLTLNYKLQAAGGDLETFLNVKNVFNKQPDPWASTGGSGQVGSFGGWLQGDDPLGRYFTAGVRYKL